MGLDAFPFPKYSENLKAVLIPELESILDLISIAVLKSSLDPTAALRFSRFLTARDQGLRTFEKFGLDRSKAMSGKSGLKCHFSVEP